MTDQSLNTDGAIPTDLPPLPEGFTLDVRPVATGDDRPKFPPLPDGFKLDLDPSVTPALPEGFTVDQPKAEEDKSILERAKEPITDPKQVEALAKSQGLDTINSARNIVAGMGERVADLFGGFGDLLAATSPPKELGLKHPYSSDIKGDLQKASQELHDVSFGYKPETTWEDVKKSPAKNFLSFAVEQGLISAPDMAAALYALPAYIAGRTGEIADQRAANNDAESATVSDLLVAMPAATASALLDRLGARGMFGLDEAAIQSLKQIPKEAAKATLKEGVTEAAQQVIEDAATDTATKKGFDPSRTAENAAASFLVGGTVGGPVRAAEGVVEVAANKGRTAVKVADELPPLPEGFTLDPNIKKTSRLPAEGKQSETVETGSSRDLAPDSRDGSEIGTPPNSSLPSVSPEERAVLRRTAIPDEDIDAMSRDEIEQKIAEARTAGIKINGAMVRAAEQYKPARAEITQQTTADAPTVEAIPEPPPAESVPIPAERPNLSADDQAALEAVTKQAVDEDREADADQAVGPAVRQQLEQTVQQSLDEDMKGNGTRRAPVVVQQPGHVDVAAQQVNTAPSDAQKEAGNYQKGHLKVSGLDVTLENPKGSIRSGISSKGDRWEVKMPAHYGYIKRSTGADGDQVDAYVGDNPQSKRVYVIDQKDLNTRRFDEHKAILGVNSVTEARDLYSRGFSDGRGAERIGGIKPMSASEFKLWLASGETTKPLAMGKPSVRLNDKGFPIDTKGNVKKPDSLVEFLARKGGVREDRGELSVLGLKDRKAGFVVGAGPLIRRNGMSPDKAREAAADGYSHEDALELAYRDLYREAAERADEEIDIPFFGDDDATDAGTAPADRAADRAEGEQDAGRRSESRTEAVGDDRPARGEDRTPAESDRGREGGERRDRESAPERQEPVTEPGADDKPQYVLPGAERSTDAQMAQRKADAPLKPKVEQKEPSGLFSDDRDQKDLLDQRADEKPRFVYKNEAGKKRDMDLVREVVKRVSGVEPEFAETLNLGINGSMLWGDTKARKARGQYNATDDVITLALDLMNFDAANHEAFHRIQNLFLTDKERAVLRSDEQRLRKFLVDQGEKAANVAKMKRVEVEAEAFAKWVAKKDIDDLAKPQATFRAIIRRAWDRLAEVLLRVRNLLHGRGFKTYEDIFGKASDGKIKERSARERGVLAEDATLYSIVDRAPDDPQKIPEASIGIRVSETLDRMSKEAAKSVKSSNRNDRVTADDGEGLGDVMHRKLVDYLLPVKRMQESVDADLNDLNDAYQTARLVEGTIRHEVQQIDDLYVQPMVQELAKVEASLEDLHRYMYAMHAPERNKVVGLRNEEGSDLYKAATNPSLRGASGMSTNEAQDIIRELSKDREKFMGIRRAASHVRAMLDEGLRKQLRAGLINKASYDRLTKQWENYVPLRSEEDTENGGVSRPTKGRGFDVRGDEFAGATGRFTPADNVITYAVNNAEQSVIRQEKNRVGTAILRFVNEFDPKGEDIAQVYWSEDPKDNLVDQTEKAPVVYRRVIGDDGKVKDRKVNDFARRDDVLATKIGGKTYYVRFKNPQIGLALRKMTLEEITGAARLVRKVSVWQSIINTRMNPAFVPINVIRDIQTGSTFLLDEGFSVKDVLKVNANIPKAWAALWRHARGKEGKTEWDNHLNEFMKAGGKISFNPFNTIEDTLKKLQKDINRASGNPVMNRWRSVVKFIEDLNDTAENGFRVAAFAEAKAKGRTTQNAAFMARDLTVDFQKKGEWGSELSSWYVFFNASVQGNFNTAKRLYRSRAIKAVAGGMILGGFMQHMWNMLAAPEDDDGENAYLKMLRNEPWKFERQLVFFIPGKKDYVTFPLAYGLNAFWHLGVQGAAASTGKKDPAAAILDSTRVAFDAFNPLGSGDLASMIMPTIGDPFLELMQNENMFGSPIYPEKNPFDPSPAPDSQTAFGSTHPYFRWIAEKLNDATGGNDIEAGKVDIHPDTLEHLWGWFTGGIGRFASQTAETATRAKDLEFEPGKTPWVRSFYGSVTDDSKKAEYYSEREKVQYAKGKLKEYQDAGNAEDVADFVERNKQDVEAIKIFDIAEKQRKRISKERRRLERSSLSQSEIAAQRKKLDEAEIEIMNEARKHYFRAQQNL